MSPHRKLSLPGPRRWKRTSPKPPPAATLNYSSRAPVCAGCAPALAMPLPSFPMIRLSSTRSPKWAAVPDDFEFNAKTQITEHNGKKNLKAGLEIRRFLRLGAFALKAED